jgi:protein FAM50
MQLQERVKAAPIAIPFVFYDGSNIPGGVCKVKKGDFVWVFLDGSRKVGAEVGAGVAGEAGKGEAKARREWARVGVDDLMMVRGEIIIPHVSFFDVLGVRFMANYYSTCSTMTSITS